MARPPKERRAAITSRHVADLAGVSQATVSRVARQSGHVSPETRAAVLRVLAETGYEPNHAARSMRTGRMGTIGLVLPGSEEVDFRFVRALQSEASRRGLRLLLWPGGWGESAGAVDGLVYLDPEAAGEGAISDIGPSVAIGTVPVREEVAGVVGGEAELGRRIAGYFANAGRTQVAVLGPEDDLRPGAARLAAFRRGAAVHDLGLPQLNVVACRPGREAAHAAFTDFVHASTRMPNAVFCTRDETAIGVIEAARDLGIRIPGDLWVVGVGDSRIAATRAYDLTSAALRADMVAEAALDLLTGRMGDPAREIERRTVAFEIIVRGSTGRTPVS